MKVHNEVCEMSDTVLLKLQKDIEEIKVALLGNEYNPAGGVLTRLAMAEREQERLEEQLELVKIKVTKIIAYATGAGAVAGFILSFISSYLTRYLVI